MEIKEALVEMKKAISERIKVAGWQDDDGYTQGAVHRRGYSSQHYGALPWALSVFSRSPID